MAYYSSGSKSSGISNYSDTTTYEANALVLYNGEFWKNISGAPSIGVTPGTDENVWGIPYGVKEVVLTGTLTAGQTTLTFTNEIINNDNLFNIYTNVNSAIPSNVDITDNTMTITFDAQSTDVEVRVLVKVPPVYLYSGLSLGEYGQHMEGDVSSESGSHGFRYYGGKLSYNNGEEWKDDNGSLTITLLASGWTADDVLYTQSVDVEGATATNNVIVSPSGRDSTTAWADGEVLCTSQGSNTLTFTCTTVPTADITVSVVILG